MADTTNNEVTEFAKALKDWTAKDPDRERLLKWLLSRCESRGFKSRKSKDRTEEDKYVIRRVNIEDISIVKMVERAMKGYNPDLDTTSWIRGGPMWPKGYGEFWPKGYA